MSSTTEILPEKQLDFLT